MPVTELSQCAPITEENRFGENNDDGGKPRHVLEKVEVVEVIDMWRSLDRGCFGEKRANGRSGCRSQFTAPGETSDSEAAEL